MDYQKPYQQYSIDRAARLKEEARAAEARNFANQEARRAWLASLEEARASKRAEWEAQVEEEIAPERERLQRAWLAAHPGKSEADFFTHSWPHLRQNVIAERERQQIEATEARMRASGQYSF
jgi:hypothetical protein